MKRVSVDDFELDRSGGDVDKRELSTPLGTTDVAINHYHLGSDERIAGLHTHVDQEEVFIVVEGVATFETLNGRVSVNSGEAIRFAPGEYQSATNDSDGGVEVIALGAPKGTEDWRVPLTCAECGYDNTRPTVVGDEHVLVCPDCGSTFETDCAECGNNDKFVKLADDGETVLDFCPNCGTESLAR